MTTKQAIEAIRAQHGESGAVTGSVSDVSEAHSPCPQHGGDALDTPDR